jgi:hypothetical protein
VDNMVSILQHPGIASGLKSLRCFHEIWDHGMNVFLRWEEARLKIFLPKVHFDFWIKLVEHYGLFHERMHG